MFFVFVFFLTALGPPSAHSAAVAVAAIVAVAAASAFASATEAAAAAAEATLKPSGGAFLMKLGRLMYFWRLRTARQQIHVDSCGFVARLHPRPPASLLRGVRCPHQMQGGSGSPDFLLITGSGLAHDRDLCPNFTRGERKGSVFERAGLGLGSGLCGVYTHTPRLTDFLQQQSLSLPSVIYPLFPLLVSFSGSV